MTRKSTPRNPLRSYVTTCELEGRKWAESCKAETLYDAELHAIRLHRTKEIKNNKARSIPLTAGAMAIMQEIGGEGGRPIGPFQDLSKDRAERVWKAAKKLTDITDPDAVIHALRHTCATRLLKATGNIVMVKDWLGHTTIKTTADTYAHVETDSMVDGAAALTAMRGTSLTRS